MQDELTRLLEDIRAGRREALDRLLEVIKGRALSLSLKVCGQVEDAEDTLQETLLKTFQSLPKLDFKDARAFNVWLYKVAKNACLMMRRKGKFDPEYLLSLEENLGDDSEAVALLELPDESDTPEKLLLKKEAKEIVQGAILKLPLPYRLVLIFRDLEQLSTKEVAEVLELSEQAVKIRLHRARALLREELMKSGRGEAL
jgi:RNA polymerase sigma-70 factor (ECF subfamily)